MGSTFGPFYDDLQSSIFTSTGTTLLLAAFVFPNFISYWSIRLA